MRSVIGVCVASCISLFVVRARADVIRVGPNDSFKKIESARAGDEVLLAPGTYRYRVHLTGKGTAARPIVIRAEDPAERPVWDLSASLVEDAKGSADGPDRGRGCWQIDGAENVRLSGIVFTGCRTKTFNSAGIRYYNGAKGIVVTDSLFRLNDNGLTGGTEQSDITVEHCEFDRNGNTSASASRPSHNIYVYGGTSFVLRYSYVHDPVQAENFHIRSRSSVIEYNWFARAVRYEGDLMTDDDASKGPYAQEMLFRGNVIVQHPNPTNKGQIIALYNDAELKGLSLKLRMISNTVVVAVPQSSVVHVSNADGTTMSAEISNNVISGGKPSLIEDDAKGTVTGTNNWLPAGTAIGALAHTVFGTTSPFKDAAKKDFTLAAGSKAVNGASAEVPGLPAREYFQNETVMNRYRLRASAKDIGAFESTTSGPGVGPALAAAAPVPVAPAPASTDPPAAPAESVATPQGTSRGGCGCHSRAGGAARSTAMLGVSALALLLARGRRPRKRDEDR